MSLMCLFPWFDYGNDISDFENLHFLVGQPIFYHFWGIWNKAILRGKGKVMQRCTECIYKWKIKIFLENFRIGSNLSRDGFMAS